MKVEKVLKTKSTTLENHQLPPCYSLLSTTTRYSRRPRTEMCQSVLVTNTVNRWGKKNLSDGIGTTVWIGEGKNLPTDIWREIMVPFFLSATVCVFYCHSKFNVVQSNRLFNLKSFLLVYVMWCTCGHFHCTWGPGGDLLLSGLIRLSVFIIFNPPLSLLILLVTANWPASLIFFSIFTTKILFYPLHHEESRKISPRHISQGFFGLKRGVIHCS